MKRSIVIYIIILSQIFLHSCITEEPYPIINGKRQPVISAFINQNSINVNILWSIVAHENLEILPITNAIVKVYEDGNLIAELLHSSDGNYSTNNITATAGKEYSIAVNIPEYEVITAKTIMPEKVIPIKTEYNFRNGSSITQTFTDPADRKNYYLLSTKAILFLEEETKSSFISMSSNGEGDSQIFHFIGNYNSSNYLGCLFNDEMINGSFVNFKYLLSSSFYMIFDEYDYSNYEEADSSYIIPFFRSLNYDMYAYYYESYMQYYYNDDYFSGDYPVHSNVSNGYGIFGAYYDYYEDTIVYYKPEPIPIDSIIYY